MRRPALTLLALAAVVAGCGSSKATAPTTTAPAAPPGPGNVLYAGGDWAVVVDGSRATAFRRTGGTWTADRSGAVKITILGPRGKVARVPQFAVELRAPKPLIESGMWVDGHEIPVKGGGLTPEHGTIYGAYGTPLARGRHIAVAYGRTSTHGTAVAWTFTV